MPGIKMRCRYRRVPAAAWQLPSLCKGRWRTKCVGRVVVDDFDNPSVNRAGKRAATGVLSPQLRQQALPCARDGGARSASEGLLAMKGIRLHCIKKTESFFSKLSVFLLFADRVRLIHNKRLQFFHQSVAVVRMHGHFDFV